MLDIKSPLSCATWVMPSLTQGFTTLASPITHASFMQLHSVGNIHNTMAFTNNISVRGIHTHDSYSLLIMPMGLIPVPGVY